MHTADTASLRFLALVLSALCAAGLRQSADAKLAGGAVEVELLVTNVKLRYVVTRLRDAVVSALAARGFAATPDAQRALVLQVALPSAEALAVPPRVEAAAVVLERALASKMAAVGCSGERVRVEGVTQPDGSGHVYVTGGHDAADGAVNAKAVTWAKRWLARHFPEMGVEDARLPGTGRVVGWDQGAVRRALRVTLAAAAAVVAMQAA